MPKPQHEMPHPSHFLNTSSTTFLGSPLQCLTPSRKNFFLMSNSNSWRPFPLVLLLVPHVSTTSFEVPVSTKAVYSCIQGIKLVTEQQKNELEE